MTQVTHGQGCTKDCLLEGIVSAQLPARRSYYLGEQLHCQNGLFVICRGPVGCLWGAREKSCLEILGPGDLWEGWGGGCQAQALGEVQGHWIKQAQWLELLHDNLIVEARFVGYVQRRLQRLHEWQLMLARGSVRARLAWQLAYLAQRFGKQDARTAGEVFVPIVLTEQQQAQLCGATRPRVCGVLREFERQHLLVCGREGFWVRDLEALKHQSYEGL